MHLRAFDLHVRALLSSRQHEARSQAHTKVAQVKARLLAKVLEISASQRERDRGASRTVGTVGKRLKQTG